MSDFGDFSKLCKQWLREAVLFKNEERKELLLQLDSIKRNADEKMLAYAGSVKDQETAMVDVFRHLEEQVERVATELKDSKQKMMNQLQEEFGAVRQLHQEVSSEIA